VVDKDKDIIGFRRIRAAALWSWLTSLPAAGAAEDGLAEEVS
jgi:hypothetical protein